MESKSQYVFDITEIMWEFLAFAGIVLRGGRAMTAEELFGRRVRVARKAARLKLKDAAKKLGITLDHLSRVETGRSRASFELIIGMADVFGVSAMSFFMFEGEETDEKALRKKIDDLINKFSANELAQVYRYLIFMVRP